MAFWSAFIVSLKHEMHDWRAVSRSIEILENADDWNTCCLLAGGVPHRAAASCAGAGVEGLWAMHGVQAALPARRRFSWSSWARGGQRRSGASSSSPRHCALPTSPGRPWPGDRPASDLVDSYMHLDINSSCQMNVDFEAVEGPSEGNIRCLLGSIMIHAGSACRSSAD